MKKLYALLMVLSPVSAFAQQQPPPSQQAIIMALHQETVAQADSLTVLNARLIDDQQQIADLQKRLSTAEAKPQAKQASPASP